MALPIILIDSATGSDTAASGAGPATALTGTAASFAAAVVTLDGTPDLSGVATDGSHVLYLVTSTGVRFFKITAADNGADTVTVTPNPAGTSSGLTWAIGGKRDSLLSSSSRLLGDNGGAAGDCKPGWVIEFQDGHTEDYGTTFNFRAGGDTTTGRIIIRGVPGAAVRPKFTATSTVTCFSPTGSGSGYLLFEGFDIHGYAANQRASGIAAEYNGGAVSIVARNMVLGVSGAALFAAFRADACGGLHALLNSSVVGSGADGTIPVGQYSGTMYLQGNRIVAPTVLEVNYYATVIAINNIITATSGIGITKTSSDNFLIAVGNTIDDCSGDGIDFLDSKFLAINNIITNNGGYGIDTIPAAIIDHNVYYNNTSGNVNGAAEGDNDQTVDPNFVGGGDYTPQEATLEGAQFPVSIP